MKLPNQTRGPVTLSKIDYAANLSEETAAFTANISLHDRTCQVRNNGRGGPNCFDSREVKEEVDRYAKTLPAITGHGLVLKMDAELLVSTMIEDAIQEREDTRLAKKGFTHCATFGGRAVYTVGEPGPEVLSKHFKGGVPEVRRLSA